MVFWWECNARGLATGVGDEESEGPQAVGSTQWDVSVGDLSSRCVGHRANVSLCDL